MKFRVSLFDEGDPQLVWILAMTKYRLAFLGTFLGVHGHALINDHVDPLEVLEEPDNVEANGTVLVENWGVHSF